MKTEETTSKEKRFDALTHSYEDLPEPEDRQWTVKYDNIGLYLPADGEDEGQSRLIEWTAIDEPLKALQIARQLSHKLWMNREMAADFLDLVFQYFRWSKGFPYL